MLIDLYVLQELYVTVVEANRLPVLACLALATTPYRVWNIYLFSFAIKDHHMNVHDWSKTHKPAHTFVIFDTMTVQIRQIWAYSIINQATASQIPCHCQRMASRHWQWRLHCYTYKSNILKRYARSRYSPFAAIIPRYNVCRYRGMMANFILEPIFFYLPDRTEINVEFLFFSTRPTDPIWKFSKILWNKLLKMMA